MSQYQAIKAATNAYIRTNGRQEITGAILNAVMIATIDSLGKFYQSVGVATPGTDPGNIDQNIAYIAGTPGTYAKLGGFELAEGEVAILKFDGAWKKEVVIVIPTRVSQLINDAGYITNAVSDLVNYYTKGETFSKAEVQGILSGYYDKDEVDSIVSAITGQSYVVAWDGTAEPVVGDIPAGVSVTWGGNPYVGTLPASASTTNKIYLVSNGAGYDEYITTDNSGYSWIGIGTTSLDLSGFATKAELTQLEHIVTNLAGKFYGVFDDDSELPEGNIVGYAFVGTAEPLALFTFDGEDWTDTEVAISGIIGPQGPQGIQGIQGIQGPPGVTGAEATIDAGTGTPSVEVTLTNGVLTFAFHNLKGLQGNTGSSVSYPFTLVNNTTTDDATQALTAAMGKLLQDQIDALVIDNNFAEEDLVIADENEYALVAFANGEIRTKNFDSSKVKVESGETIGDDFDIRDESNNMIVVFADGHIKTKNFDSSLIGKTQWYGKNWMGFGTSITNTNNEGKYAPYLAQLAGLVFNNHGHSGGGITASSNESIYDDVMSADFTDIDLVTLEVGANDGGAALGTIYDGLPGSDVQDNSTFCGALNLCIRHIQENSSAQVVVISSPNGRYQYQHPENKRYGNETSGPDNHTYCDMWEITERVCKLNSCWYIPGGAMDGMGLSRMNASNDYNIDQIHQTDLGGFNFAQAIWSFLKNIPLFYTSIQ